MAENPYCILNPVGEWGIVCGYGLNEAQWPCPKSLEIIHFLRSVSRRAFYEVSQQIEGPSGLHKDPGEAADAMKRRGGQHLGAFAPLDTDLRKGP